MTFRRSYVNNENVNFIAEAHTHTHTDTRQPNAQYQCARSSALPFASFHFEFISTHFQPWLNCASTGE